MAKLLIAEDDRLMRWSLEKFLTRAGHEVDLVESGKAALEAMHAHRYCVAIINHASDALDFRIVGQMKAQSPATHVIILSAKATSRMERIARDAGAFDFLEKPFDLTVLRQAVETALETPERRKGPRGCCGGCEWQRPCEHWQ